MIWLVRLLAVSEHFVVIPLGCFVLVWLWEILLVSVGPFEAPSAFAKSKPYIWWQAVLCEAETLAVSF